MVVSLVAIALISFAVIVLIPSPAPAQPVISWVPELVNETVLAGETKTISASFSSSQDLGAVEVSVVPALEPFVQTNPTSFASITAGQTTNLDITISAPADASPQTVEGTIQFRNAGRPPRNFARPLPVTVNIKPFPVSPEEVLSEIARLFRNGDTGTAEGLIIASEEKIRNLETLSRAQLIALADFYDSGVLAEEIGDIRVYKSVLRENDGSESEVTFRMERDESGRWRVSW
jgi:hypothetical protein